MVSIMFLQGNNMEVLKTSFLAWLKYLSIRIIAILTIQELFIINLKAHRKLRHISQSKLADLCDSSTGYIGEIETGKCFPSVSMIERIACALEIESWQLFKNEPVVLVPLEPTIKLSPSQKNEITKKANAALSKILEKY